MTKKFSAIQQRRIYAGQKFIQANSDSDLLFNVAIIIGPSLFGALFESNTDIVWSRIEDPAQFRIVELFKIAKGLNISIHHLFDVILNQIEFNKVEKQKGRPIGKQKYIGF